MVGLREIQIDSSEVLQQLVDHAAAARSTGSTGANDESSRHARWGGAMLGERGPRVVGEKEDGVVESPTPCWPGQFATPDGSGCREASRLPSVHSPSTEGTGTSLPLWRRSHSVMVFTLKQGSKPRKPLLGKLSFIDLAGSERGAGGCRVSFAGRGPC